MNTRVDPLGLGAILLLGTLCALAIFAPMFGAVMIIAVAGLITVVAVTAAVLHGRVAMPILAWALIFPLGYYCLSFPREKSIFTLDRALPFIILPALAFAPQAVSYEVPAALRKCAFAWALFVAIAGVSLSFGGDLLTYGRLLVDSFCLPAVLAWAVIRNFDVRKYAPALHTVTCVMSVYVMCIGAAEMILNQDLLALPGSSLYLAGSLPRPNGPFYNDDSFALIGLVSFFFLQFLKTAMGEQMPRGRRVLHLAGLSASLLMGLMPMFRSVLISLLIILMIETATTRKPGRRAAGIATLVIGITAVTIVKILVPEAYEDRSKPDNFYVRLAEQMQTFEVVKSHPLLGVGLGRFKEVVTHDTTYMAAYQGVQSIDSPHNNLGSILSETGILGFVPYVISQLLLVSAFWRLHRKRSVDGQTAWKYFLYVFLSYWINGLTLASGYNSDLNCWFMLALAVMYKFAMTEPEVRGNNRRDKTAPLVRYAFA